MKKAALMIALALALVSTGALAEERSFALNREQSSDIYAWGGAVLTEPDTYLSIYSVTNGGTAARDELFAAQSANQAPPEDGDYVAPRYALLDAEGKQLTDFLYDSLDYDASGDAVIYSIDGQFGAMTRALTPLVPCEYDAVLSDGAGGFLMVAHGDENAPPVMRKSKDGGIEPTGANARFYWGGMSEGLIVASGDNGLSGYLNAQGQWAIKPKYGWAQNFTGGYAIVREKDRTGVIDTKGRWTVKPTYDDDRGMLFGGGAALLMRGSRTFAVRPSDGRQLFSVRLSKDGYVSAGAFSPFFSIMDKDECTLYDSAGREILSVAGGRSFDLWSDLPEDRLLVTAQGDSLLMDFSGNTIASAQGIYSLGAADGVALFQTARFKTRMVRYEGYDAPTEEPIYATYRYGMIDANGQQRLPMIYTQLYQLIPGRYYAQDAQRWGVIDENGQWIVSGSLYDQLMD